jgi:mannitol/fructose-specific phosphotransferase system IIA component (Ntr-type)
VDFAVFGSSGHPIDTQHFEQHAYVFMSSNGQQVDVVHVISSTPERTESEFLVQLEQIFQISEDNEKTTQLLDFSDKRVPRR